MNDILATIWGYETFQQCIPSNFRSNIAVLVGNYFQNYVSDKNIEKVLTLEANFEAQKSKKEKSLKEKMRYVKDHWND